MRSSVEAVGVLAAALKINPAKRKFSYQSLQACGGLTLPNVFPRSKAGVFPEDAVEVGDVVKAGFVAGVENMSGFVEALAGIADALAVEVMAEGFPGQLFE